MKKILTVIIIVIVLLIIIFSLKSIFSKEALAPTETSDQVEVSDDSQPKETINVKHQYKNGEHILVGTINLPSPCYSYNAEIIPGDPNEIKITLTDPEAGTVCAQVITPRDFRVTHAGLEDEEFKITINGRMYNINIFEIDEDQDIDSVELYIKG